MARCWGGGPCTDCKHPEACASANSSPSVSMLSDSPGAISKTRSSPARQSEMPGPLTTRADGVTRTVLGVPEVFTTVKNPRRLDWPPRCGQLKPRYSLPTALVGMSNVPSLEKTSTLFNGLN